MNIKTVNKDIQELEKALAIIEKTENYTHFRKAHLIFEICEQINILKDKVYNQTNYSLNTRNLNL